MYETEVRFRGRLTDAPVLRYTADGTPYTTMRVATSVRRPDPDRSGAWIAGPTSYYSVTAWRSMGLNASTSLKKGEPVYVMGKQKVETYERKDGTFGTDVKIEALALGHDLLLGQSTYVKPGRALRPEDESLTQAPPSGYLPSGYSGSEPPPDPMHDPYVLEDTGEGGGSGLGTGDREVSAPAA